MTEEQVERVKTLERELEECQERLAAAEARVKRALEVLSRIPPDSPIHGKDMRILRKSETAALDTALEQARDEGHAVGFRQGVKKANEWLAKEIEQARAEGKQKIVTVYDDDGYYGGPEHHEPVDSIEMTYNEYDGKLEQARAEGALQMWKDCALAIDSVMFPENSRLGGVWAACSRAIRELKPSKETNDAG